MQSEILLQTLAGQVQEITNRIEKMKSRDLKILNWRPAENAWNILECLEHLNLYGDFYLPTIESGIKNSATTASKNFKSGILGGYFAKSMLPKEKLNKMKTFKDKNPIHAELDKSVIERSLKQQEKLQELIDLSKNVNLNKVRIPTSISSLLRLKLGDTFQFFINHIIRHLKQIEQIEEKMSRAAKTQR